MAKILSGKKQENKLERVERFKQMQLFQKEILLTALNPYLMPLSKTKPYKENTSAAGGVGK